MGLVQFTSRSCSGITSFLVVVNFSVANSYRYKVDQTPCFVLSNGLATNKRQ